MGQKAYTASLNNQAPYKMSLLYSNVGLNKETIQRRKKQGQEDQMTDDMNIKGLRTRLRASN